MQNSTKIAEKIAIFAEISAKIWKSLTKICEDFELRAVQRCGNLVDFEKRCKMTPWTQKSALIQLRTSLLKFDELAENFERSSVSNFSTKVLEAAGHLGKNFAEERHRVHRRRARQACSSGRGRLGLGRQQLQALAHHSRSRDEEPGEPRGLPAKMSLTPS